MTEGKLVMYEDTKITGYLLQKGATVGHISFEPKEEFTSLEDMPEELSQHILFVANTTAGVLFEALGLGGTNIIVTSKPKEKVTVHVVPRKPEDGLNFLWEPNRVPEMEMKTVQSKIKDAAFMIGYVAPKKKVINLDEKRDDIKTITSESSYAKYFRRKV